MILLRTLASIVHASLTRLGEWADEARDWDEE